MAYLRAPLLAAALASLAACGGNGGGNVDALIIVPDAAPDARPIDAPPDGPSYNLGCFGGAFPTTAPATITAGGTTQELGMNGLAAVADATISTFKVGTTAAVNTVTSGANGNFTTGGLATGGLPFDGYIHSFKDDAANAFRNTFVFPPAPLAADLPVVPVIMLRSATFDLLASVVAGVQQNDADNGALMLLVTDCANTPMAGVAPIVKQGANTVGTVFDLSSFSSMATGIYFVYNVPAGDTDVSATYMGMSFPSHRVIAFKNENGITTGATTLTIVRPGPL
jgi:hypothetical protein